MQKVKGYEACTAGLLSDVLYLWNESKSRTKSCLSHRGQWCKTKALETATFWHSYFVIKDFIYEKKKDGHTLCVCALPRCYYSLHPSVILSAAAAQVQFGRPSLSILLKRCTPTLWSVDGLRFLLRSTTTSVSSAGVPRCAPIPFSQVIAQGILIKAKTRCWGVTSQTSCDFNVK